MLQTTNLTKIFSSEDLQIAAVNDVSLRIEQGEFVAIMGRSGSGKTTLLSLLGGLEKPTNGSIIVDGQDITKLRDHALIAYRAKKIGFIFQAYNLVPNLTAIENVILSMEAAGYPRNKRKQRAQELLGQVGFSADQMRRKPGRLSGGQQQRVAIARALANKPKVIFADEPTGNLDEQTGEVVFSLLHELSRQEKTTVIVVTHDLTIAAQTDKVFNLKDGKLKEE